MSMSCPSAGPAVSEAAGPAMPVAAVGTADGAAMERWSCRFGSFRGTRLCIQMGLAESSVSPGHQQPWMLSLDVR